jgi:hypothetical protein
MMGLGNKQDAIDKLLRASGTRPGALPQVCREFDADLANAYVERSLTTTEIARYEQHLSACAPCRQSVVALVRMSAADPAAAHSEARPVAFAEPRRERLTDRRGWFGALLTPRWAMAAAAAIVLAISLPFLLAPKPSQSAKQSSTSELAASQPTDQASSNDNYVAVNPTGTANPATPATQQPVASNSQPKVEKESVHPNEAATVPAPPSATAVPPTDALAIAEAPKPAAEAKPTPADEAPTKTKTTEPAPSGATGGVAASRQNETPLPKIDPAGAKKFEADKETAPVTTLRPGLGDGTERPKADSTIRPDKDIAPPPKPPASESSRGHKGVSAKDVGSALRGRDSNEMARSKPRVPGRKIAKKQFWLRDNVWTDENYSPDKDMPVVTLIRDSDVYKEVLVERAGMKSYLTGFGETESVIFVYKDTVYKLVPQKDNK